MNSRLSNASIPVLGFAAWSGTGKTTLLKKVLQELKLRDIRVAMIKHAHHEFDIDIPGKDSYELRKAGAQQMLIASSQRWALMVDDLQQPDPDLDELLAHIDQSAADIILVEGFRHYPFPKIELHRSVLEKPLMYPEDKNIIALVSDLSGEQKSEIHCLDIDKPISVVGYIMEYMHDFKNRPDPGKNTI